MAMSGGRSQPVAHGDAIRAIHPDGAIRNARPKAAAACGTLRIGESARRRAINSRVPCQAAQIRATISNDDAVAISPVITGGVPVEGASEALRPIVVGRLAGLPGILYWWAALGVGVVLVLRNTRYGRTLYALGANTAAAFLSGVRVRATRAVTYAACAAIAGIAGFLYLGFVGSVYNITLGDQYMLGSIVAVVVGGVALTGGVGGYAGVAVGAVLLQVLESVLTTINIQPYGRDIIFGSALLLLLCAYARDAGLRR